MVFTEPLTWLCHICGEARPDARISVRKKPIRMAGSGSERIGWQNIRYCNDRPACVEGSKTYSLLRDRDE